MISVELLAKHMGWANQEIFKEVKKLGPDVLDYYVCLLYTSDAADDQ